MSFHRRRKRIGPYGKCFKFSRHPQNKKEHNLLNESKTMTILKGNK